MTEQAITLDITPSGVPPMVYADQYDRGRTVHVYVKDQSKTFTPSSSYSYVVCGTKPTGTGFSYNNIVSVSGQYLSFDIQSQMTSVAGDVPCSIIIYSGNTRLGTLHFILHVQKAALSDNTVVDSNVYESLVHSTISDIFAEQGIIDPTAAPTLLWANSSPDSVFDAQDITVTAGFNLYLIIFNDYSSNYRPDSSGYQIQTMIYAPSGGAHSYGQFTYMLSDAQNPGEVDTANQDWSNNAYRSVVVYPSSGRIHFNSAMRNGFGPQNSVLIPWYVFGMHNVGRLLWVNSAPTSMFAPQDISIESGYNLYYMVFRDTDTDGYQISLMVYAPSNGVHSYAQFTYKINDTWYTAYRTVVVYPSSGTIHFNAAVRDGLSWRNGYLVPWYVFGFNI